MPCSRPLASVCLVTTARLGPGDMAPSIQIINSDNQILNVIKGPYRLKAYTCNLAIGGYALKSKILINIMSSDHCERFPSHTWNFS